MYASSFFLYAMWMPWDSKVNEDVRREGEGCKGSEKSSQIVCVKVDSGGDGVCCSFCCTANVASFLYADTHTHLHTCSNTHAHTHTHTEREKEKERERVRERNYPIAVPNELNFHFFAPTVSQAQPSVRLPLLMSLCLWLGFLVELLQRCQIHHKPARAASNTGQRSARQSAQLEEDSPKLASAR